MVIEAISAGSKTRSGRSPTRTEVYPGSPFSGSPAALPYTCSAIRTVSPDWVVRTGDAALEEIRTSQMESQRGSSLLERTL